MTPVVYVVRWNGKLNSEERQGLLRKMPAVRRARLPMGKEERWDQPLAAWGLLSYAVCRELGLSGLPEVAIEEGGRPFFPTLEEISFSLSHTEGIAACGLWNAPIGVDAERFRSVSGAMLQRMGVGNEREFFSRWVAREAAAKRAGKGGVYTLMHPVEGEESCQLLSLGEDAVLAVAAEEICKVIHVVWQDFIPMFL